MNRDKAERLMEEHPPTIALAPASPGYVLLETYLLDGEVYKYAYPVIAWVARNNIHPELTDYLTTYTALVLTLDYGPLEADSQLLGDDNGQLVGIMTADEADAYDTNEHNTKRDLESHIAAVKAQRDKAKQGK